MKKLVFVLFVVLLMTATACAPEPTCETADGEAGILWGFVHGLVFPFALIAKVLGMDYGLYDVSNTGFWYWLGYIIGFGGIYGGLFGARRRR